MKAIFLNNNPAQIDAVYTSSQRETISQYCQLHAKVITRDDFTAEANTLRSADFIFSTWGMPVISAEEISSFLPKVRAVFYAAGSVQYFAAPLLQAGIKVISGWQANAVPVAEYAASQIILANKGFFSCRQRHDIPYAQSRIFAESFPGNYRTKVGLLGAGAIGKLVIKILLRHDLALLVYDPFLTEEQARLSGVTKASLEEIFTSCQTISNHLANNRQTKNLLTGKYFNLMRENATFINTGRGAQVNESDLAEALQAKPGRSAVLDVTEPEPPARDSELFRLENVILTPHIAGSSGREVARMAEYVIADYLRLLAGQPLEYEVTEKMLATMA